MRVGELPLQEVPPIVLRLLSLDCLVAELTLSQQAHRRVEVRVLVVGDCDLVALLFACGVWSQLVCRHTQAKFYKSDWDGRVFAAP